MFASSGDGRPAPRVYCLAEDRQAEEVGLRIALASLRRACPSAVAVVYRPNASADLRAWLAGFSNVRLIPELPVGAWSWNCKPHVLLPLLEAGHTEAIWLDSDMLVARDPSYLFDGVPLRTLIGTQEPPSQPHQGSTIRTTGWRLPVGTSHPMTLNSWVLRVTVEHIPLLRRWKELLTDPEYTAAQRRPVSERPIHHLGDQDVLNALFGSAEFADVPVHLLRCGVDVIHCGGALGYSLGQRLVGLFRPIPPFLHAIGSKPWIVFSPAFRAGHSPWFSFYRGLLQETSPYVVRARGVRREVGLDCPWLDAGTWLGRLLRLAGLGHYALRGLPLTLAATALDAVARWRRSAGHVFARPPTGA